MFGLLAVFSMNCACLCVQPVESGRGTGMLGMLMLLGFMSSLMDPAVHDNWLERKGVKYYETSSNNENSYRNRNKECKINQIIETSSGREK